MNFNYSNMNRACVKYTAFLGLFAGMVLMSSCDKDRDYDEIPFAYVDFYINPNSTIYWELNSPNGWIYLVANSPSRGILVYRDLNDQFLAYERTCAHDPLVDEARIEVEASSITAACPSCKTKYILLDGYPFEGPGKRPLKRYQTSYNGNTLHIYN